MKIGKRHNVSGHQDVMVSSTYSDLVEHRKAVIDALVRLGFFPIGMEFDSSKAGKDIIASSMEMVAKSQAYVGIVSHRYGGVPEDAERNPHKLSITELEYREALKSGIPVYMFLMSDEHPVKPAGFEMVAAYRKKLQALKDDARLRSICAEFSSVEELKSLVLQSMFELKEQLTESDREAESAQEEPRAKKGPEIPSPPGLFAVPNFVSGHEFVGRRAELAWLDEWATGSEPLIVIEAIGGAGKSTLAWQWINERATTVCSDLKGVMWYSFYEGGADMAAFAAYALAYMTGQPLKEFYGRKTADLARSLLAVLREQPFLLVLDGLERVLVAYNRLDASQARDDQVASDRGDRACIKPSDGDLLRQFIAANPSKIIVTSRLMPSVLTNRSGLMIYGVRHRYLGGLHSDDALTMMRSTGVRGNESTIRDYLKENFDNHPLLLGIVAGLVNDYIREPGNFDRWADDPQGGAALNLSKLDLSQRRTHILAAALDGLEPGTRQLLSRIAALGAAVPYDTVAALNPFLQQPPDSNAVTKLVAALQDLEQRGLLQWDRKINSYDLHPVVRGYAFDVLEQTEREDICNQIVDHFQSKSPDRYEDAKTLADVQQSINIFRALIHSRRFDDAASFYMAGLSNALIFSVEAYREILALLKPLFPEGVQNLSSTLKSQRIQAHVINVLGIALNGLGRFSDAREAFVVVIRLQFESRDLINIGRVLRNLAGSYFDEGRISSSFDALDLALALSEILEDSETIALIQLSAMKNYRLTRLFDSARSAYDAFRLPPTPTKREIYRPGEAESQLCYLRFYQGMLTDEQLDEAEAITQAGNNRRTMRDLARLRGELALQRGDALLATTAFERVIEMTHLVGAPVEIFEARLALAKALAGDHDQAREICDRLNELAEPPHVGLASAYLNIGEQEKARYHALKGYSWAWAEGPPYSRWWELEQCRTVLKKLGEPEPNLPAFDPEAVEPLPYEQEIRKLIADWKEEKE
jgi:tetratricopeptide (TPR) repeat protein